MVCRNLCTSLSGKTALSRNGAPRARTLALIVAVCSSVGCDQRQPDDEVLEKEPTLSENIIDVLKEDAASRAYPLAQLRATYFEKQDRNFREAMGLAGQAIVKIERGMLMSGQDRHDFVLRGFFLLQKSLNDCRATAAPDSPVAFYSYLNACLSLAHLGEMALLHSDDALLKDVIKNLRYLRKRGHALFARMNNEARSPFNSFCVQTTWVFCDGDPPGSSAQSRSYDPPIPI